MIQTVETLQFHCLKRYQTALKTVQTVPSSHFSAPSDTVSDIETVDFLPSGASMGFAPEVRRALQAIQHGDAVLHESTAASARADGAALWPPSAARVVFKFKTLTQVRILATLLFFCLPLCFPRDCGFTVLHAIITRCALLVHFEKNSENKCSKLVLQVHDACQRGAPGAFRCPPGARFDQCKVHGALYSVIYSI